ncbi:MAG: hypothetical protein ACYC6N_03850, partial [Pirellulaceae bacterium]
PGARRSHARAERGGIAIRSPLRPAVYATAATGARRSHARAERGGIALRLPAAPAVYATAERGIPAAA